METEGVVDVLNVGSGHLTIRVDDSDPIEKERARRMISDMLRRGYALFVEIDGVLTPVRSFDAERDVYIVADVPGLPPQEPKLDEEPPPEEPPPERSIPASRLCPRGCGKDVHRGRCGRRKTREVPVSKARATAIGRTAGG